MLSVSITICNPDVSGLMRMLNSLKKYTPELSQLIIVDNGSEDVDMIKEIIKQYYLKFDYIRNEKNLGFGETHNQALKIATGKYFAVLNDDIEFYQVWSTPMIEELQKDNMLVQVGMALDTCTMLTKEGMGYCDISQEPDYIEGSCFIMPIEIARKYNLFDTESYKIIYFEDSDLSLRLKRDGYKIKTLMLDWKHWRTATTSKVKIDIRGYHVLNNYMFRKKWGSYLFKKRFGKIILVRRMISIGDVFLTTPIFAALREKYPEALLVLQTQCPQMVEFNPYIDVVLNQDIPFPCDEFINLDFAYEKDFRKHIVDAYADVAGVIVKKKTGDLVLSKKDVDFATKVISDIPKPRVVLELSTTWLGKQWLLQSYQQVAINLKKLGYSIITIGSNNDLNIQRFMCDLNLVNMLNIPQTAFVIGSANLFIGHVGLMSHVAQSVNIPSIVLYGCEKPEYSSNIESKTVYPVISPVVCYGCRNRYMSSITITCPRNHECMKEIKVEDVVLAYQNLQTQLKA